MKHTTTQLTADSRKCPHCGRDLQLQAAPGCPSCQPPSAKPAGPSFGPRTRVVLEIMPSGTCELLNLTDTVIMGRKASSTADLNVFDLTPFKGHRRGVSRQHCAFERTPDRLLVRDLGSTNGTFLNGHRLEPGQQVAVQHGDDLILGELLLMVYFNAPQE